jgi:hypothetical protein
VTQLAYRIFYHLQPAAAILTDAGCASSYEIDPENVSAIRAVQGLAPARPLISGIVSWPTRMLAGIHTVKDAVMDRDVVWIAALFDFYDLQHLARFDIVLNQLGGIAVIAWHVGPLRPSHLPQRVGGGVIFNAMDAVFQIRQKCVRELVVHHPCLGIYAHQGFEPVGADPQFSILPGHAMTSATIVRRAERNLAMADLARIHVGLEDAIDGRIGMVDHRNAIGAAPDTACRW